MKKNSLLKDKDIIIRLLDVVDNQCLIINCMERKMPVWVSKDALKIYEPCSEQDLYEMANICLVDENKLDSIDRKVAYERYTLISPILPWITDNKKRQDIIRKLSELHQVSKQTIRHYLCLYLAFQKIAVLANRSKIKQQVLSQDEKNMRWALNKYFYCYKKNSLKTAYIHLLKERYCDNHGNLQNCPTFYQFRYFYRKTKKMQHFYIARNGIKDYQKNYRPLLGDGIQDFACSIGTAMLDSTICDIFLVNESGQLVGRPILTACIDAYSSLCCGYALTWEGGVYSLRQLMLNIITNKQDWCKSFGICINREQWAADQLPGVFVTDQGREYMSETFGQMTELGITVINLPAYRPELKGSVEKFFDIIQSLFKPYLKGKGVIEPDFQQRGAHDYRKDACLTLREFEKILLRCIIYYNSQRVINFPFTEQMLKDNVKPYACAIWNWGKQQMGSNLIQADPKQLLLTLLPRTTGTFTRKGLIVNKIRYKNSNYTEQFLQGGNITVAYNPDDVSQVWVIDQGSYIPFDLIESRYYQQTLNEVQKIQQSTANWLKAAEKQQIQDQILLAKSIESIASSTNIFPTDNESKKTGTIRQDERIKNHIDFMEDYYD